MNLYDYVNFTITGGVKQVLISKVPLYGRYNTNRKVKGLEKVGLYKHEKGEKPKPYDVGDEWGELEESLKGMNGYYDTTDKKKKKELKQDAKNTLEALYKNRLSKEKIQKILDTDANTKHVRHKKDWDD